MITKGDGPALLGINGFAGSGKSTAAQVLLDAGWTRIKFADPLKDMLRSIGLDDRHIEGDLKEIPCTVLRGKTPRYAMQTLGHEWGRQMIGDDLWTSIARRRIALAMAAGLSVVVDDVRFENEAELIRGIGGSVLRLSRGEPESNHPSENSVTPDISYANTGTLAELQGFMHYVFLSSGE